MKLRATSYTFNKTAKTVVCSLFTSLEAIQLITNVTDNIIIYNFADATKGGTLSGTTLTLTYDTAAMDDADKLQILVEDGATTQAASGTVTANIGTVATLATAANQLANNHNVVVTSAPTTAVTGTFFQATQPVSGTVTANAGTNLNTSTLALEAGGNLATIKTNTDKIPSQGKALAANSTPVVLTAAQVTTLTPPAAITGFATSALQTTQDTSINTLLKPANTLAGVTTVSTVTNLAQQGGVAIALNTGTRSAGTQRVTIATNDLVPVTGTITAVTAITNALPAGTNAIGKLAANSGVDIGDVDVTTLPARVATTDGVGAFLATNSIMNGVTALTPRFVVIDHATSGDNTILSAVVSRKIRVLSCFLVSAGAVNVRFESGASGTALTGQMNLTTNSGFVLPFNPVGWFETASNTLLNLELSGAISVDGSLTYVEV